jgi:hypothetical protein
VADVADDRAPEDRAAEIGVAFGDTPASDDAVRVAADLRRRTGARLRVLTRSTLEVLLSEAVSTVGVESP